jgi:hypothetical protein
MKSWVIKDKPYGVIKSELYWDNDNRRMMYEIITTRGDKIHLAFHEFVMVRVDWKSIYGN